MTLQRDHVEGACNAPQPGNWRNVCRLRPGHTGEHRAPTLRGPSGTQYDYTWPGHFPVEHRKALGRRHYVRPAEIGR